MRASPHLVLAIFLPLSSSTGILLAPCFFSNEAYATLKSRQQFVFTSTHSYSSVALAASNSTECLTMPAHGKHGRVTLESCLPGLGTQTWTMFPKTSSQNGTGLLGPDGLQICSKQTPIPPARNTPMWLGSPPPDTDACLDYSSHYLAFRSIASPAAWALGAAEPDLCLTAGAPVPPSALATLRPPLPPSQCATYP